MTTKTTVVIGIGGDLVYEFPDDWSRVSVYLKASDTERWILDGTFDAEGARIRPAAGSKLVAAAVERTGGFRIPWAGGMGEAGVFTLAGALDNPMLALLVAVDADFGLLESVPFRVDVGAQNPVDAAIRRDENYLALLVDCRAEAAKTDGIATLQLPDGRVETYRNLHVLNNAIQEVEARLAIFRASMAGAQFVGATYR